MVIFIMASVVIIVAYIFTKNIIKKKTKKIKTNLNPKIQKFISKYY